MPNTNKQRSRSGLCERVIRRDATETEGLEYQIDIDLHVLKAYKS